MSIAEPHQSKGLYASLSGLGATLVAIMRTRLQLLAVDLEEDSARLLNIAKLTLIMLFCFGVAVMLLTILITVIFWDSHRILVLSTLACLFMLAGFIIAWHIQRKIAQKPSLFASSLSELVKDWQSLDIHARDLS
jgi:uncharacterized membrane protein YqjE